NERSRLDRIQVRCGGERSIGPPSADGKIKSFYLGETEVTQKQWQAVMGSNPVWHKDDELPIMQIDGPSCIEFCKKVNAKMQRLVFRLPTEAEWARAFGASEEYGPDFDRTTWSNRNSGETQHPVGRLRPNAFGLYDMLGNVRERVGDASVALGNDVWIGPNDGRFDRAEVGAISYLENTGFRVAADIPSPDLADKVDTAETPRESSSVGGATELKKRQFDDRMAAVKAHAASARSADELGALAMEYASVVSMAVELGDYDRANRLAATMVQTARKTRDCGLQADVQARAKQAQQMRSAFNAAKPALAKLEADAANAEANAAWGRYVAWVKDHWDEGLPLLAKGGDDVAAIAARELAVGMQTLPPMRRSPVTCEGFLCARRCDWC
ncbi:MAG TPA: SUMF1/EgtB/PvdO family nonheme iron enzyme, partial [Pirellulales bacterium]|nr:SUMF1/EgtB/PvdO family nonheme iron enzyme [Pirellulales bacterium]